MHRSGRLLLPVQVRELDGPRLPRLRGAGEDPDACLLVVVAVEADRAEQALVAVAVRIELDHRRVDIRQAGGSLEGGADRVVEVDRGGDLAEEPAALRLLLGAVDGARQLPRELVEPRFERLDRRGHLGLDVASGPAAQPAQQLERHEDADDERYSETDGKPMHDRSSGISVGVL